MVPLFSNGVLSRSTGSSSARRRSRVRGAHTVPMETPQSMLEEPSKGSKHTQYFPRRGASTKMAASFSSDTSTHCTQKQNGKVRSLAQDYSLLCREDIC